MDITSTNRRILNMLPWAFPGHTFALQGPDEERLRWQLLIDGAPTPIKLECYDAHYSELERLAKNPAEVFRNHLVIYVRQAAYVIGASQGLRWQDPAFPDWLRAAYRRVEIPDALHAF